MAKLADITREVVRDVATRRDPADYLSSTQDDVTKALDFFRETLELQHASPYMLNLFADLAYKVQAREVTIQSVEKAIREYRQMADENANAVATLTELIATEQFKNRDLRAELRAAIAQNAENEAYFYEQGRDSVMWIWADLVAQDAGITIDEAFEEIIRHIVHAENPAEVESDDAA